MKLHAPLRTLALLTLAPMFGAWFQTASAQIAETKAPVELWWGVPTIPASEFFNSSLPWFNAESVDFTYLEARGDASHAGVWVYLSARVRVDPGFENDPDVAADYKTTIYRSLWDESYYDFNANHLPANSNYPDSILSQTEFEGLITWAEAGIDPDGYNDRVPKKFQPLLTPTGNVTARCWDAKYSWWPKPGAARGYWKPLDIDQSSQILSLEAWIKKVITDQTGGNGDGIGFWFDAGEIAIERYNLRLQIQAIMVYGEEDPSFPSEDWVPPRGPKGSYLAVGTSTPLEYSFAATSSTPPRGKDYPMEQGVGSRATIRSTQQGSDLVFGASKVVDGTTARLFVVPPGAGGGSVLMVDVRHGPGLQDGVITVPMSIPDGSWFEITALESPLGPLGTIPPHHRDKVFVF